ncbi:MAG: hypothetical protein AAB348_02550 [Patescibacteria group bacterium]
MPMPEGEKSNIVYLNSRAQDMTAPLIDDPYEQEMAGNELAAMRAKRAVLEKKLAELEEEEIENDEASADDYSSDSSRESNVAPDQDAGPSDKEEKQRAVDILKAKQNSLKKIRPMLKEAENKLKELEKDLSHFKGSKFAGALSTFMPRINLLTDKLLDSMKQPLNKMSDEQKVIQITMMLATITALIILLQGLRGVTAFIDAMFTDKFSCLRMVIMTSATIVIPIILIILAPLTIPFIAVLFILGMIPLVKGLLTNNIIKLIDKLKDQKQVWQKELDKAKKRVALRRQIKKLKEMEASIATEQAPAGRLAA